MLEKKALTRKTMSPEVDAKMEKKSYNDDQQQCMYVETVGPMSWAILREKKKDTTQIRKAFLPTKTEIEYKTLTKTALGRNNK